MSFETCKLSAIPVPNSFTLRLSSWSPKDSANYRAISTLVRKHFKVQVLFFTSQTSFSLKATFSNTLSKGEAYSSTSLFDSQSSSMAPFLCVGVTFVHANLCLHTLITCSLEWEGGRGLLEIFSSSCKNFFVVLGKCVARF